MYDNEHLAAVIEAAEALMAGNNELEHANAELASAQAEQDDAQVRVEELEATYKELVNPSPVSRVTARSRV